MEFRRAIIVSPVVGGALKRVNVGRTYHFSRQTPKDVAVGRELDMETKSLIRCKQLHALTARETHIMSDNGIVTFWFLVFEVLS